MSYDARGSIEAYCDLAFIGNPYPISNRSKSIYRQAPRDLRVSDFKVHPSCKSCSCFNLEIRTSQLKERYALPVSSTQVEVEAHQKYFCED